MLLLNITQWFENILAELIGLHINRTRNILNEQLGGNSFVNLQNYSFFIPYSVDFRLCKRNSQSEAREFCSQPMRKQRNCG